MALLDADQLLELEDLIMDELTCVLARKNVDGTLERLLDDMGLADLLTSILELPVRLKTWSDGYILVVGAPQGMEHDLRGAAKTMGVDPERIDFVPYEDATNYVYKNLEWSPKWCAVLFGASPHSGRGKGEDSSILAHLESHRERYPEVRRLVAGGRLKDTMSNFRRELSKLIDEGMVIAA